MAECTYPFCDKRPKHAIRVCSTLNHRCLNCLFCGHQAGKRCEPIHVQANLSIFEALAEHGYVTGNRFRDHGAANGFYPVIELCQLQHVSMHGGYARLLSLFHSRKRKPWWARAAHCTKGGLEQNPSAHSLLSRRPFKTREASRPMESTPNIATKPVSRTCQDKEQLQRR
jgi:hypothetical protein